MHLSGPEFNCTAYGENETPRYRVRYALAKYIVRLRLSLISFSLTYSYAVDAEAKCPICLEASCTTVTACKHTFHADCLERWMAVKSTAPTCPVCRASLSAAQDMRSQLRDYFILNYEEWNELHAVFGAGWYAVYWWWLLTLNRWQDFLSQSR
jgi:hypothetical protein